MTTLAVVSAFRNSPRSQVSRWARQCSALQLHLRETQLKAIAVEGDSSDNGTTRQHIIEESSRYNLTLSLHEFSHGRPFYGSVVHPDRMSSLSLVTNAMLDAIPEATDYVLYVESDLIWDSPTISSLLSILRNHREFSVVSPMVFAGPAFYDIWAFRGLDGVGFSPLPPYHKDWNPNRELIEVSSVGSCLFMRGPVSHEVRVTDDNALVGWCSAARQLGHRIAVATDLSIRHP